MNYAQDLGEFLKVMEAVFLVGGAAAGVGAAISLIYPLAGRAAREGWDKLEDYVRRKEISQKINAKAREMSNYFLNKTQTFRTWREDLSMIPVYSKKDACYEMDTQELEVYN